jgi:endo-beta-N-acetylglucosaminidase D
MKQKLLVFSLAALAVGSVSAQQLKDGYIAWPSSQTLPSYVTQWKNGNLNMEDEQFFISRVKPKARFRNSATQVNTSLTSENSKRLCFWVPMTTALEGGYNYNALPNSAFDSEVFSMWSYVDVFGNWTSPHGWVPGAFADVAHKNGVSVSGVASIPNASIANSAWGTAITDQVALDNTTLAEFLYYHGVDGLGYNSEFSGLSSSTMTKLAQQHEDLISYLESKGVCTAENIWYDGTNINGNISFDSGLNANNFPNYMSDAGKRRSSLFTNYNWTSLLGSITNYAKQKGVSPLYIYAGMNMQGGEPKSGESYPTLKNYNVSMGYWGAHQYNMFWLNRTKNGSAPLTIQATYLYDTERFFTNGAQNPAVNFSVFTQRNHYPTDSFFGISAFKSAESTLQWSLDDEPFITYFNMGNGQFFNWQGQRANSLSWYNIGVQDYLPTWRYWWAPTLLGRDVTKGSIGLSSTFVWTDAYMGGSCLSISGTDDEAYLHLFKTKFDIKANDVITVRYKLLGGSAEQVSLIATMEGAEDTPVRESSLVVLNSQTEVDGDEWQTATFTIRGSLASGFSGKTLALLGLHFKNAQNLQMLLGEVSIVRGTAATPAAPEITLAKVLGNHYQGVDGKLIFKMASSKTDGPVYNTDVNTSMFKIYAREEGGEPVLMGVTTSWAAMLYNCPFNVTSGSKVQFGVSALSLDHKSESAITWSNALDKGDYTVDNAISIDKTVIKPGEKFTIGYVDPKHSASDWKLYDSTGKAVFSANGTSFTTSLDAIGGYDLKIDEGTDAARSFGYYVQVSSEEVGALPEIYTVTVDGNTVSESSSPVEMTIVDGADASSTATVGYTGRPADGSASRGIEFDERFIGCKVADLGLESGKSFSVAFWVKYTSFCASSDQTWALLDITNRGGSWPVSNWGYCWLRGDNEGHVGPYTFRGSSSDSVYPGEYQYSFGEDTRFNLDTWTHVVITFDYASTSSFRSKLYLNGVLQQATWVRGSGGTSLGSGTQEDYSVKNYALQSTDWLSIGGLPYQGQAVTGVVDDFQVWDKAMDESDVKTSFAGLDAKNLPDGVLCYWDFETDAASDYSFSSVGKKEGVKLYNYDCIGGADANEGQGLQTPFEANTSSGCPFISGTAYPVVTKPSWSSRRAVVTNANGSDTAGSATVAFTRSGDHTLTLSLENSYGSATATYPVFSVASEEGSINEIATDADGLAVYSVTEGFFVEFGAAGKYAVAVYDMQGRLVAQHADDVTASQMMLINIHNPGAYLVKVVKDGRALRTFKVAKN